MSVASPVQGCGLEVVAPPAMPIAQLVTGKPVAEVVELLPLVFNLCKAAQSLAVRMACGMAISDADIAALTEEITREHRMRLTVLLPAKLGLGQLPFVPIERDMSLNEALAASPLLAVVAERFAPHEACVAAREENSVAGRQAEAPLMREIADVYGRGPLWRVTARAIEATDPQLPDPRMEEGYAVVPAARGSYRIKTRVEDGVLREMSRYTPTDDMLGEGGIIAQTLASLPRSKSELAPLVLDIIDPCVPLSLREVAHA